MHAVASCHSSDAYRSTSRVALRLVSHGGGGGRSASVWSVFAVFAPIWQRPKAISLGGTQRDWKSVGGGKRGGLGGGRLLKKKKNVLVIRKMLCNSVQHKGKHPNVEAALAKIRLV